MKVHEYIQENKISPLNMLSDDPDNTELFEHSMKFIWPAGDSEGKWWNQIVSDAKQFVTRDIKAKTEFLNAVAQLIKTMMEEFRQVFKGDLSRETYTSMYVFQMAIQLNIRMLINVIAIRTGKAIIMQHSDIFATPRVEDESDQVDLIFDPDF